MKLYSRRAGKVEDMLSIEEEVSRVRGEIEAFEAKKKNWDILTELVTIDITLHEPSEGFPSFQRLWYPIKSAFGTAAQFFVDSLHALIVFIGAILPWLVILGPLAYLLIRRQRKKRKTSVLDSPTGETSQEKQDGV
jgi:hypothetical protein